MFINISTDQVHLALNNEQYFFDRDNVEKTFGPKLIELARKHNFSDITILNGPGGFTNLRVGTLCLNMLNTLFDERFDIYDIDKISLYTYLVQQGFLPDKGIIYIGQRKNIWEYNFKENKYTQTQKTKLFGENSKDSKNNNGNDEKNKNTEKAYFFDLVYDKEYFGQATLDITGTGKNITITTVSGDKTTVTISEEFKIKPEKYIKANYFIQPILGKQGQ